MNKKNVYNISLLKLKKQITNMNIGEELKSRILERIEQVNYIDKSILSSSSVNNRNNESIRINKFYKTLLKKHRANLVKLLTLIDW